MAETDDGIGSAAGVSARRDQDSYDSDIVVVDIDAVDREVAIQAITRLERELFGRGAWSEGAVRQELAAPARTYLLAVSDAAGSRVRDDAGRRVASDGIVGYAGFWYDGDDAELMTIGVDARHRRQGIAATLLERLVETARERGAARMLLEVRVDNDPALALYRRFGFVRLGLRKRYYQPEGVDAYTMGLDLNPRVVGFSGAGAPSAETDAGMPPSADHVDES